MQVNKNRQWQHITKIGRHGQLRFIISGNKIFHIVNFSIGLKKTRNNSNNSKN